MGNASIADVGISVFAEDVVENPKKAFAYRKVNVKVYDAKGNLLKKGTDYTYDDKSAADFSTRASSPAAGTGIELTLHGKGFYAGDSNTENNIKTVRYSVIQSKSGLKKLSSQGFKVKTNKSMKDAETVEGVKAVTLKAEDFKTNLTMTADYTIVGYVHNYEPGTARVVLRGAGNYYGMKVVDFKITE